MLAKKNRANTKIVEKVFKTGRFINSPLLTFRFIVNKEPSTPHISFIAPKSVAKLAVDRNKLRRRGYTALRKYINKFPLNVEGVIVFKKTINTTLEVENEIQNILSKIN